MPELREVLPAGTAPLGLGERLFINRGFFWRDGLLHVPTALKSRSPVPLLVWLHGGGGQAQDARKLFPLADEFGVAVLALDSRHNTWDGIDSPFGPDVRYIERALAHVAARVPVDEGRIAIGGVSDGGSYALALGRTNGDLFSHLIAISPWRLQPPAPARGAPQIFIGHGRQDSIYPEWHSRRVLVPSLRGQGYEVTYFPYDGPHWVTEVSGRALMEWIAAN
jgi:predicted esterase